jgi:hypothetical protein
MSRRTRSRHPAKFFEVVRGNACMMSESTPRFVQLRASCRPLVRVARRAACHTTPDLHASSARAAAGIVRASRAHASFRSPGPGCAVPTCTGRWARAGPLGSPGRHGIARPRGLPLRTRRSLRPRPRSASCSTPSPAWPPGPGAAVRPGPTVPTLRRTRKRTATRASSRWMARPTPDWVSPSARPPGSWCRPRPPPLGPARRPAAGHRRASGHDSGSFHDFQSGMF